MFSDVRRVLRIVLVLHKSHQKSRGGPAVLTEVVRVVEAPSRRKFTQCGVALRKLAAVGPASSGGQQIPARRRRCRWWPAPHESTRPNDGTGAWDTLLPALIWKSTDLEPFGYR